MRRVADACLSIAMRTIGHTPSRKSCITSAGNDVIGWKPISPSIGLDPTTPCNGDCRGLVLIVWTKRSCWMIVLQPFVIEVMGNDLSSCVIQHRRQKKRLLKLQLKPPIICAAKLSATIVENEKWTRFPLMERPCICKRLISSMIGRKKHRAFAWSWKTIRLLIKHPCQVGEPVSKCWNYRRKSSY